MRNPSRASSVCPPRAWCPRRVDSARISRTIRCCRLATG
ncbi:hypothetical protein SXIM_11180 [Streptomyces xiamenensis]|uniref:Uncharacterized protein n=1 Tax=Streptomyces xiamenensis TaxID=408015 RepID=A0A0F7FQT0_9ACTN|nr:hypothetical protein SXIM_11180 [Streptomyces xiamenensis]